MPFPTTLHEIAGQPIADLAAEFGTPVYVYDAAPIVRRIDDLRAFDVIRYAQKACSNLAILDLMRRQGVLVDAVSAGEVRRAIAAGFRPGFNEPPEIVYTADIFDRESLEVVIEHEIPVNCGSPDMIDQYGQRSPGRGITLRFNPGFGHGHSQKTNTGGEQSKHGIWYEQIGDCVRRAAKYGLSITGIHMHIGSGSDMHHLSQVCDALERVAIQVGPSVHTISAGGGLPISYKADQPPADMTVYFELWNATRRKLVDRFGHPVSLEIEPGRYLVAESGYLLTEIRAVKQMGANRFYLVDAGFNNLARPILYGAYHPMAICHIGSEPGRPRPRHHVVVGGPLCESGDIFTQEEGGYVSTRELPEASVGDILVIGYAGAYGFVMGSNYNSKPLAAEVLIESGKVNLVRKRQVFEDLPRGEVIPTR
jgi:diaminopimelate decarboxylase